MNEFVTDLEKSVKTADNWLCSTAGAIGDACHHAGDDVVSAMAKGRDLSQAAGKSARRKVRAADAMVHRHPYPVVLIAAAAGALVATILGWRLNTRCASGA